ncbi:glycosyltransferase involved in cell wall biosynthesis [Flavobacterium glaciei]|uniref:Glycosyltransferase involved in cell wall biosynthesis n=2 Tax=Flavobacterium glaciei TaxID=386300 RepID=A0A562PJJ2_9FLAO|nr:glycosyltransferase involved in cell wall biosynthesis [Flavobacterium glaciei]TWI44645.1 glycosyltransferase involved in cell wall biosynthesis [Flavobacterium glaciei]
MNKDICSTKQEKPMRVAVVTSFPPSKVTLNEYGYHLVKNFVQKDEIAELILITDKTKEPKQLDFENSNKVLVKECWEFNSYTSIFTICKTILKEKPDAVLFNLQFVKFGDKKVPAALGLLIPMILRLLGCNTVVLLHNILEQVDLKSAGFTDSKIAQKIYNFIGTSLTSCILKADIVAVTISKYVTVLNEKYKTNNVVLIPHGTFEIPKNPCFDLPEGPKKVMAFGKFGTYKKVEILIDAIELIRKNSNESIEIIIAGTDSPNTPGYLQGVKEKYANVPGITFTGYVEENEVATIFNNSTMVVFPYTSTTGSSGVLHQAGSYGKAVVMPDLGDLSILVKEEGYKGEFFDPESKESLANAISSILNDDNYRRKLAMNNYEAACELSMDKIVQMYIGNFKQVNYDKVLRWAND